MTSKFTRLTHKTAIQLHLVAESCTICSGIRTNDLITRLPGHWDCQNPRGSGGMVPHLLNLCTSGEWPGERSASL